MDNSIAKEIKESFSDLISQLSSLDQEHLNIVPFEGSWTAGQLGDHLRKSYDIAGVLKGKTKETDRDPDEKAREITDLFLNFDIKMKSPDFILPTNGAVIKEELLGEIKERSDLIVKIASTEDLSLLCLDFELPNTGFMTRFEWISFVNVHTIRHNWQLRNIIKKLPFKTGGTPE